MLISGSLYRLLSAKTQQSMRHVDRVTVKGSKQPMDLYTCDVNPNLLTDSTNAAENAAVQETEFQTEQQNKKVLKFISRKRRAERYREIVKGTAQISAHLINDTDIATMTRHYTQV